MLYLKVECGASQYGKDLYKKLQGSVHFGFWHSLTTVRHACLTCVSLLVFDFGNLPLVFAQIATQ
jgi:membrane-bound metal-dependent hydrolase YbcI (DUF457 family)